MKIKVFIVIDNLGTGGAQRQVVEYLKFAGRDKFDLKIVNLDKHYDTLAGEITGRGYEVIGIEHRGFLNLWTVLKLVKLFKIEKPDIVYTYLFTADCYGRLAAKLAGVPVMISAVRNIDAWKGFRHILIDKILGMWTDKVTVNAQGIKPFLRKSIPEEKVVTIYNGIDLDRWRALRNPPDVRKELGIPVDAFVVGMVARFSEQKDYRTFFQAGKLVIQEIPDVYFLAVGEGVLKYRAVEIVQELGICKNVVFTGLRKDVPDLINSFDVGVLSSHYEGCSNAIMEYMVCAKAVVASNVGGNAELVQDGSTGYIVEPRNARAMAERIIFLLRDKTLREKMGQAGRTRIEREFTVQKMARNTEGLFEELLQVKRVKREPKIAFIVPQFPRYDETFISREFLELKNNGLDFYIFSLQRSKDKVAHQEVLPLMAQTVNVNFVFSVSLLCAQFYFLFRRPLRYLLSFLYIFKLMYKSPEYLLKAIVMFPKTIYFARLVEVLGITHIHAQWAGTPVVSAMVIKRLTAVPFSFTGHAHDIYADTAGLKKKIDSARFVLTCTASNKTYLSEIARKNKDRIIVSYHGIDLTRFKGNDRMEGTCFRILSVGSLLECKGFDILIAACRKMKDAGFDFECTIAGGGPLEADLTALVAKFGLEGRIRFTGYISQEDIIPWYQKADVFALPVRLDIHWGIPNVLLEAMAVKIPVVTTGLVSLAGVIEHGKNGFIIPEKDPAALFEILTSLYKDPALRKKTGQAGYAVVCEKFDLRKNARRLADIFKKGIV